jgi:hypothetical protein
MAKSKKQDEVQEPSAEAVDAAAVYDAHNHETAKNTPAEKQCQCEVCKAHREAL